MKRLCVLLCAMCCCAGCAGDKGQWDEFWKDLRGDNMQMRGDFTGVRDIENSSTPLKVRD